MSNIRIFHFCLEKSTDLQEVTIVDNWATICGTKDCFPVYKECCHFYHLDTITGKMEEVDYSDKEPILNI